MIEYLNFFLLSALLTLIFWIYIETKKLLTLLKMAEENLSGLIPELAFKPLQSQSD